MNISTIPSGNTITKQDIQKHVTNLTITLSPQDEIIAKGLAVTPQAMEGIFNALTKGIEEGYDISDMHKRTLQIYFDNQEKQKNQEKEQQKAQGETEKQKHYEEMRKEHKQDEQEKRTKLQELMKKFVGGNTELDDKEKVQESGENRKIEKDNNGKIIEKIVKENKENLAKNQEQERIAGEKEAAREKELEENKEAIKAKIVAENKKALEKAENPTISETQKTSTSVTLPTQEKSQETKGSLTEKTITNLDNIERAILNQNWEYYKTSSGEKPQNHNQFLMTMQQAEKDFIKYLEEREALEALKEKPKVLTVDQLKIKITESSLEAFDILSQLIDDTNSDEIRKSIQNATKEERWEKYQEEKATRKESQYTLPTLDKEQKKSLQAECIMRMIIPNNKKEQNNEEIITFRKHFLQGDIGNIAQKHNKEKNKIIDDINRMRSTNTLQKIQKFHRYFSKILNMKEVGIPDDIGRQKLITRNMGRKITDNLTTVINKTIDEKIIRNNKYYLNDISKDIKKKL